MSPSSGDGTPGARQRQGSKGWTGGDTLRFLSLLRGRCPSDWAVGGVIASHLNGKANARDNGLAFPSRETIAAEAGVTERTVTTALGRLTAAGILAVTCRRCRLPRGECRGGRGHNAAYTAGPAFYVAHPDRNTRTTPAQRGNGFTLSDTKRGSDDPLNVEINDARAPPPYISPPEHTQEHAKSASAPAPQSTEDKSPENQEQTRRRNLIKAVGRDVGEAALAEVEARIAHAAHDHDPSVPPVIDSKYALARAIARCYRGKCGRDCPSWIHGTAARDEHVGRRRDWALQDRERTTRTRTPDPDPVFVDDEEAERRRQIEALRQQAGKIKVPVPGSARSELVRGYRGLYKRHEQGEFDDDELTRKATTIFAGHEDLAEEIAAQVAQEFADYAEAERTAPWNRSRS